MQQRGQGPFREKSLERLSSPERLDQLLRAVDRKSWIPLATLSGLVLVLLLWAVIGKVPIHVQGKGILLRPREIVQVEAPGTGYLAELRVRVGDTVEPGEVLGRIARPELEKQLELQRQKALELTALGRAAEILRLRAGLVAPPAETPRVDGSITEHVRAARELAEALRERELQSLDEEQTRLEEQLRLARELSETLRTRFERRKSLEQSQILSAEDLIAAEESYVDSLVRVSTLEAQLRDLRTDRLRVEESYLERLQRIADLTLDMQSYEQQAADVSREIDRLETLLEQEGRLVAEHGGRMLEISAVVGEYVTTGERIGSMAVHDSDSPLGSVTYFTVRDGKRLGVGDRIQVTPDPVERERYGGILGRITSISEFPITLEAVESVVGNRGLAESLITGGYLIEAHASLEPDPEAFSRLRWSSSRGPEMVFSTGTTTTARVAVEKRPPITFVLPFLRQAFGID